MNEEQPDESGSASDDEPDEKQANKLMSKKLVQKGIL